VLVFFVGFAAILKVPGLKGPDVDLALFKLSLQAFPSWFVGIIGATGVLTALVPGSMILMAAATLVANNLYRPLRPAATDKEISRLAKLMVPVVALVSVYFTLQGGDTIVQLLLMGYAFVTQIFPALIMSLTQRNLVTRHGAIAGIVVGVATVAVMTVQNLTMANLIPGLPAGLQDLNVGIVALTLNIATTAVVSLVTRSALRRAGATV
jgi:SSS family solute:Na+ symporter